MPPPDSEDRTRRLASLRATLSSHTSERRLPRRLFSRTTSAVPSPIASSSIDDNPSKRSFRAKPPTPGATKRVFVLLREQKKSSHHSSSQKAPLTTRIQSLHPSHDGIVRATNVSSVNTQHSNPRVCHNVSDRSSLESSCTGAGDDASHESAVLDVVTSDVSDDLANVSKVIQGRGSSSEAVSLRQAGFTHEPTNDLLFIDDVNTQSIAFNLVGDEEDTVPAAPTSKIEADCFATYDEHVRTLQAELDTLKADREKTNTAFRQHNRQQNILLNSLRTRAEESSDEVKQLIRQLRDTRKRLNRRIRELEENAEVQKVQYTEQTEQQRTVEAQLRAEVGRLRKGAANAKAMTAPAQRLARTDSLPASTARRRRTSAKALHGLYPDSQLRTNSLSSEGQFGLHPNFDRVRSASNVHEVACRTLTHPNVYRSLTQTHQEGAFTPMETSKVSSKTLARRSLLRRSFVAHIHSSRYKSIDTAWHDFFGVENGQVTPEQFSRAVRRLAIAANARDCDLELLRQEVSGAEENDTGVVTWGMFVRFYGLTKHEPM